MSEREIPLPFQTQADWTEQNIQKIRRAIENKKITTTVQLKSIIGNQSKKKALSPHGIKYITSGSKMLGLKLNGQIPVNTEERKFYNDFTGRLKNLPTIPTAKGLVYIAELDPKDVNYEANKKLLTDSDKLRNNLYDYLMGKYLVSAGYNLFWGPGIITNESKEKAMIGELDKIARLRGIENSLFELLIQHNSNEKNEVENHKKAEEREYSSIRQIQLYLANKKNDFYKNLETEARYYEKYLKYKAKYLALKKST